MHNHGNFPLPGATLRYQGAQHYFWFTDMIENAQKNLTVGSPYTLKSIVVNSSSAIVTLEETGDLKYSLGFFTY